MATRLAPSTAVPAAGETRSNMHVGGRAEKVELTERDREICAAIGPLLREKGQIFVGIDVIGDWLTEIKPDSRLPGLQELERFDGTNRRRPDMGGDRGQAPASPRIRAHELAAEKSCGFSYARSPAPVRLRASQISVFRPAKWFERGAWLNARGRPHTNFSPDKFWALCRPLWTAPCQTQARR